MTRLGIVAIFHEKEAIPSDEVAGEGAVAGDDDGVDDAVDDRVFLMNKG